jgi:hypothetical protein
MLPSIKIEEQLEDVCCFCDHVIREESTVNPPSKALPWENMLSFNSRSTHVWRLGALLPQSVQFRAMSVLWLLIRK